MAAWNEKNYYTGKRFKKKNIILKKISLILFPTKNTSLFTGQKNISLFTGQKNISLLYWYNKKKN
jgi:hypothetical protein